MDEDVGQKIKLVDKYIEELAQNLSGGFNEATDINLRKAIEKIIIQEDFLSRDELVFDFIKTVTGKEEITPELQILALKTVLAINNWQIENIVAVRKYRAEKFEEKFVNKTKEKNPNLSDEKIELTKQKAKLVSKIYFSEGGIENQRELVIQNNNGNIS